MFMQRIRLFFAPTLTKHSKRSSSLRDSLTWLWSPANDCTGIAETRGFYFFPRQAFILFLKLQFDKGPVQIQGFKQMVCPHSKTYTVYTVSSARQGENYPLFGWKMPVGPGFHWQLQNSAFTTCRWAGISLYMAQVLADTFVAACA